MTGVTNLSEGSIVYGNASEIVTELTPGSDGDSLKISSGIPSWASGAGDGFGSLGSDSSTAGASALTVSGMADKDIIKIYFHCANDGTNARLLLNLNSISTTSYNSRWWSSDGVGTFVTGQTAYFLSESLADQDFQGEFILFKGNTNLGWTGNVGRSMVGTINTGAAIPQTYQVLMGSFNQDLATAITEVSLSCSGGNIIGDMQVLGMNYV